MQTFDELVKLLETPELFKKLAEYADESRACCSSD